MKKNNLAILMSVCNIILKSKSFTITSVNKKNDYSRSSVEFCFTNLENNNLIKRRGKKGRIVVYWKTRNFKIFHEHLTRINRYRAVSDKYIRIVTLMGLCESMKQQNIFTQSDIIKNCEVIIYRSTVSHIVSVLEKGKIIEQIVTKKGEYKKGTKVFKKGFFFKEFFKSLKKIDSYGFVM